MIVLLGVGFLAGVVTAISPCVLPVLPIILAGSSMGGRRRPFAIITGLVLSFSLFLLIGTWLLDLLGLPQDFLRNVAIGLLFLLAAMLIVPRIGLILERPLARLGRRPGSDLGGGFLLGLSLGLVFVPCAGPVLTAVTVVAAAHRAGLDTVFLTFAYALGAAVPMLVVAMGGQRLAGRASLLRRRAAGLRVVLGLVIRRYGTSNRLQPRPPLPDLHSRLHECASAPPRVGSNARTRHLIASTRIVEPETFDLLRPGEGERYLRALPAAFRGAYLVAVLVEAPA